MKNNESYEFLRGFQNNHINIGFGSYGQVKLARNTQTKELVAIKLIYNKNAKEEIALHKRCDHPSIIKLLNFYYIKEKNITYMVLEYADGGTLFEKIKGSHMSKDVIRKIFKQICQGVAALHANGIMHRDIKPQNILLTKKNDAKLCDFGFAAILGQRRTLCGTYEYMAPEMIQGLGYDFTVDIWALGILLFEMVEGVAPFRGQTPQEVLSEMKMKYIQFSEKFDKEEYNLIKSILRVNPSKRPSVKEILEHPYFLQSRFEKKEVQNERISEKAPQRPVNQRAFERQLNQRIIEKPVEKPFEKELDKQFNSYSTLPQSEDDKIGRYAPKTKINDSFRDIEVPLRQPPPTFSTKPTYQPPPSQILYNPMLKQPKTAGSTPIIPEFRSTSNTPIYNNPIESKDGVNASFKWRKM